MTSKSQGLLTSAEDFRKKLAGPLVFHPYVNGKRFPFAGNTAGASALSVPGAFKCSLFSKEEGKDTGAVAKSEAALV